MKNILIGLLCATLPLYRFITWIIIFNHPDLTNQAERVAAYHQTYFMDLPLNETYLSLISVFLVAIGYYFVSKVTPDEMGSVLKNLFLLVLGFLGLINIWGML